MILQSASPASVPIFDPNPRVLITLKKTITALALGGLSLLSAPAYAGGEGWIADFDEAVKIAKAENKDLFVDFTGSDWCGWCIKLDSEVFSHEEFLTGVKDKFVLVALDYPNSAEAKAKVPNPERNAELVTKYGIRGYPTILLMNNDGIVYGKTGYQEGGPAAYVEHLDELVKTGRAELEKVQAVLDKYNAAPEGSDTTAQLGEILTTLEGLTEGSPFASMLTEYAERAITADPKNEKGLKLRAVRALTGAGVNSPEILTAAKQVDPKNAEGIWEAAVNAQFSTVSDKAGAEAALVELDLLNPTTVKDKDIRFKLNFTAARWASGPMGDAELAKTYARIAKGIGTEQKEMMEFLDELLADDAAQG